MWVHLHRLRAADYAESGGLAEGVLPVFVTLLVARLPDRRTLRAQAERLAAAIAVACSRPRENVHALYLPEAAGRIAFGGVLLED